ncbi:MAG TPA: tetratricopeptide repeat protein [Planctomycetota bacterium]|nr:tetratricopeptide repeat protein [Planctomycetota bacterium]
MLLLLAGCGNGGGDEAVHARARQPETAKAPREFLPPQIPRSDSSQVREAARALERGDLAAANRLILALPGEPEAVRLERTLLRARLLALEGDGVAAVREIEAARAAWPDQAQVYATAAELHSMAGRVKSAEDEIRRGLEVAGPMPELTRARGVLALGRAGGARAGLEHLLAARKEDPELDFCDRPLAQAHLLLGNAALAATSPLEAMAHARAGLLSDPVEPELRALLGDAQAASGELDAAIATYEELFAEGRAVRPALESLLLKGATAALVDGDRPLALQRWLRARELGVSDEDLGFGATALRDEAQREIEQGTAAYAQDDLERAGEAFRRALVLEPGSLAGRNHLAVVLFRRGEFDAAAHEWRWLLETSRARSVELPEPVHLNLARALRNAGRLSDAREPLEDYLRREPEGEWAAETLEMLARLPAAPTADGGGDYR